MPSTASHLLWGVCAGADRYWGRYALCRDRDVRGVLADPGATYGWDLGTSEQLLFISRRGGNGGPRVVVSRRLHWSRQDSFRIGVYRTSFPTITVRVDPADCDALGKGVGRGRRNKIGLLQVMQVQGGVLRRSRSATKDTAAAWPCGSPHAGTHTVKPICKI